MPGWNDSRCPDIETIYLQSQADGVVVACRARDRLFSALVRSDHGHSSVDLQQVAIHAAQRTLRAVTGQEYPYEFPVVLLELA